MTDLNRLKKLAGLTMEMDSARGLLKEYTVTDEAMDGEITKDSVKKSALELLVDIAKTSKQYKGEVSDDQVHYLGSLVHDFDMAGIETEKYSEIEKLFRTMADTERADMEMIQPAYAQAKKLDEEAMDEEEGMIVYVGDQKFEYSDYTLEDAMRIVDEYADEMEGEPYEVYNADGKLVASGTMRSGAFHEPGIEEGKSLASLRNRSSFDAQNRMQNKNKPTAKVVKPAQMDLFKTESMPMKPLSQPKRVSMTNKENFRKNFSKRYIDMYPATSEGHSPHKKGTKKYKAHMAAMHANEDVNQQYADVLKSKNQIKINAFLQGLDSETATRLTGGQAQTSKISSDGQSIGPSGDAYTHGKPGLSKQTIRMTKPVADRKYGESKLQDMRKALKLSESADANTVVAEYTRATLNHSYKTWKQVNEQIEFIRSFVKEDVDVNAVAVMLHRMHERENLDHKMLVKENVSKLRQIVKENNTMKVTFNDGDMNVDATTAKVFLEVYNKQKSQKQNQIVEKIQTKSGFLSMLEMMYKKIG